MKIAIFEVEDWERDAFQDLQDRHEVFFCGSPLTVDNAGEVSDAEIVSTFIYSDMQDECLKKIENLKLIATRSTGFEHIAMKRCRERGIKVANVPSYGENTVAEHVFALLGAISHKLMEAVDRTRRGDFSQQGLQGFDLMGKTLGVIGTGHIGMHAARIAKGYRMEVVAFDVKRDRDRADEIGFRYVEMDELLAAADIITIHVPGGHKTRHLISDDEFGRKHNLETLLADHVLLRLKNVIITPHSAFNTREAVQRILDTTHENIAGFIHGEPVNIVTAEE